MRIPRFRGPRSPLVSRTPVRLRGTRLPRARPAGLPAAAALILLASLPAVPLGAQALPPEATAPLSWRHIGPSGNRAIAVIGEPGDPMKAWVGAASGGVWKTENGGVDWRPTFDEHEAQSIGSLAIAPTAYNEIWAGTGETFIIRPALAMGNGIYKSTDAGETWTHMGLEETGRIGRIVVHPRDSDVVFACALGHGYGPQPERGVFRTTDGGDTWEHVLFADEGTGCSDLAIDPERPDVLFAGMWSLQVDPWMLGSGGTGGGVYVSRDGGDSWEKIAGRGLPGPDEMVGKTAVAIAPSDPDRVYALVEMEHPTLFRSENGGRTWRLVNRDHDMAERAGYYVRMGVDPENEDRVYFLSVRFGMSVDGGETLVDDPPRGGGDTHDIWIDPTDPDRFMVADDGGATITLDHGESFQRIALPIAQMYHAHADNEIPYNVYGNRQDGYSYKGPSNSRAGFISDGHWHSVGGCESGFAIPDTARANEVWSGCYDGGLEIYYPQTTHVRNVRVWPEASYGWPPAEVEYRWHWTFPIALSHHEPGVVYVGSQYVHRSDDEGASWTTISPDLTTNDKSKQQSSGPLTTDNLYTFDGSVLYALAESPAEPGILWSGSNDGQVQLTRDGGESWTNVTENIPGVPHDGQISNIEPSRWDAGTAYITIDRHQLADFDPYIFRTTDFGATWTRIDAGIPRTPFSFTHVVREDPERRGMLYAGTDNGVFVSLDDGASWTSLQQNMPHAPVYWITIQPHFSDVIVGTYGRGIWILDDVTALRALDADVMAAGAHLFEPRPAYRFQPSHDRKTTPGSNVFGQNPDYGASLHYWLGEGTAGGAAGATVEIVSPAGEVIRTLDASADAGLNRVQWDLRHESPTRPRLRTPPPRMPWIETGPDGFRPLRTWDLDLTGGQRGPLAVPGTYTVRVTAGDEVMETSLEVLKDPTTQGTLAQIEEQVDVSLEIRDELDEIAGMINRLEWVREQVEKLGQLAVQAQEEDGVGPDRATDGGPVESLSPEDAAALEAAAAAFREKLLDVEGRLFDLGLSGAREDAFRGRMRLYGRLSALGSDIMRNGADFEPTRQQVEVHGVLQGRLDEARRLYRLLFGEELPTFNATVTERGQPAIIS